MFQKGEKDYLKRNYLTKNWKKRWQWWKAFVLSAKKGEEKLHAWTHIWFGSNIGRVYNFLLGRVSKNRFYVRCLVPLTIPLPANLIIVKVYWWIRLLETWPKYWLEHNLNKLQLPFLKKKGINVPNNVWESMTWLTIRGHSILLFP